MAADFRGYLNTLGQQGDLQARNALNYIGGDYTGGNVYGTGGAPSSVGVNAGALGQWNQGNSTQAEDNTLAQNALNYVANAYRTYTGTGVLGANTGGITAPAPGPSNQQSIDLANAALGRIPGQLQNATRNINTQYDQGQQSLNTDAANAATAYGQGQTTNQQQYRTGQNQVRQSASQDRQSLLRMLAGMGAGGGSEAQYLVPDLVGNVASKGLSGAAGVYGQNAQNLTTNYGNFQNEQKTQQGILENQHNQNLRDAQARSESSKQSLLQTLAGLQANPAAAQPYIDQINASANAVDQLGNYTPQYTGTRPVYTPAALSTFTPAGNQQAQVNIRNDAQGATPSFLSLIQGLQKDKNQLQPAF